jgi:hypothetical protein
LKNTQPTFGTASAARKQQSRIAARMTLTQRCLADFVATLR